MIFKCHIINTLGEKAYKKIFRNSMHVRAPIQGQYPPMRKHTEVL